ncbi:MAG TPA: dihydrolipoamide acetyltransferase family protein [Gaiellaceae bacterium]|nr:dihydrolipoamide acetyltransferase family protein [Gaiellaceae bacterium]
MAHAVRMPPLGETTDELRIVEWLKAKGDEVALGEPLLAVETDKATLEVEAAAAGTLLEILHHAGESVRVGTVVAYVGEQGEEVPEQAPAQEAALETAASRGLATPSARRERVTASPAVRRLARGLGIDLSRVQGSGPGGRIEKQDVLGMTDSRAIEGEPVAPHRQALARRLGRSATIPQLSVGVTVDMTQAAAELVRERSAGTPGLSYTHLLLRAIAVALRAHPNVNRLWIDEGPRRRRLERVDVGLAVAGEDTVLVVTVPEPDRLSPTELVEHTERAVAEARAGRISERYRAPAAVTLSNLGMFDVDRFSAVIDPDQTAILAAGAVVERPGLVAGEVRPVRQLELTLTVDHRVLDGMAAGLFLVAIRQELERAGLESAP